MGERLASMLGLPRTKRAHRALIDGALAAFPEAPRHARDALARAIVAHRAWRALSASQLRVRRLIVEDPAMGESSLRVPPARTVSELARLLDTTVEELEKLADRRGMSRLARTEAMRHHHVRLVPKAAGGHRVLEVPKSRLREMQRRVLHRILTDVPAHPAACGFVRRRSVIDYVTPHVGQALVVRVDLRDFFSSIGAARVGAVFRAFGYPDEVRRTLTTLTTVATPEGVLCGLPWSKRPRLRVPHLAQGAPTSPALANLVAYGLDVRLSAFADSIGARYGRYADDLVISGGPELVPRRDSIHATMVTIARDEGFEPSFGKSRIRRAGERQELAGLVVNRHAAVPRRERERIEAILTNCVRLGPESQNRDGHPDFRAWLRGKIAWIAAACPRHAEKPLRLFAAIEWPKPANVSIDG
jgi:RNA-directed DNA polymerase